MSNKEIYKRTLGFSVRRLLFELLAFIGVVALIAAGFLIGEKLGDKGLIGLAIGLVFGIVFLIIFTRYISYTYKAGQIAMMTRAVTTGELPDDVIGEGKKIVKERFVTIALYFAATRVIHSIFSQLGKGLSGIGKAVGGDTGETIGNTITSIIQVIVSYLSDCCLGWVFYRKEQNTGRATCEGAVLFFKHGKTFIKNMGRVFGMGIVSLLAIGGVFSGAFYLVFSRFPQAFESLAAEFAATSAEEASALTKILSNPTSATIGTAILAGVILWSIVHGVFVRPFILTGVLRNYMEAGMKDIPTEESFAMLDSKSDKFAKLHKGLS